MKYEEIIKLLDAGYTREEILDMKESPAEDPTPEPEPDPGVNMETVMREMKEMFSEMRKEFTAFNIMNSTMPAEQEKTSEDILANIINPNKKEV